LYICSVTFVVLLFITAMRGPATRESVKRDTEEARTELALYDAGDPTTVQRFSEYSPGIIQDFRSMVQWGDDFALMSFEEQQEELDAINRMNRKSSSALVT
jgi:hypothetical protein